MLHSAEFGAKRGLRFVVPGIGFSPVFFHSIVQAADHAYVMVPSHLLFQAASMATFDENSIATRARLALDVTAIGQATLDGDLEEARFRAHYLRSQATELGLNDVANAAVRVITFLPPDEHLPQRGIGVALLQLCDTLNVDS